MKPSLGLQLIAQANAGPEADRAQEAGVPLDPLEARRDQIAQLEFLKVGALIHDFQLDDDDFPRLGRGRRVPAFDPEQKLPGSQEASDGQINQRRQGQGEQEWVECRQTGHHQPTHDQPQRTCSPEH